MKIAFKRLKCFFFSSEFVQLITKLFGPSIVWEVIVKMIFLIIFRIFPSEITIHQNKAVRISIYTISLNPYKLVGFGVHEIFIDVMENEDRPNYCWNIGTSVQLAGCWVGLAQPIKCVKSKLKNECFRYYSSIAHEPYEQMRKEVEEKHGAEDLKCKEGRRNIKQQTRRKWNFEFISSGKYLFMWFIFLAQPNKRSVCDWAGFSFHFVRFLLFLSFFSQQESKIMCEYT